MSSNDQDSNDSTSPVFTIIKQHLSAVKMLDDIMTNIQSLEKYIVKATSVNDLNLLKQTAAHLAKALEEVVHEINQQQRLWSPILSNITKTPHPTIIKMTQSQT